MKKNSLKQTYLDIASKQESILNIKHLRVNGRHFDLSVVLLAQHRGREKLRGNGRPADHTTDRTAHRGGGAPTEHVLGVTAVWGMLLLLCRRVLRVVHR